MRRPDSGDLALEELVRSIAAIYADHPDYGTWV